MRIKEVIKEKGLTVEKLADMLGISRQALSRQINGKLLVETAEKIANTLGVPVWQLFISPGEVQKQGAGGPVLKCPYCGRTISLDIKGHIQGETE